VCSPTPSGFGKVVCLGNPHVPGKVAAAASIIFLSKVLSLSALFKENNLVPLAPPKPRLLPSFGLSFEFPAAYPVSGLNPYQTDPYSPPFLDFGSYERLTLSGPPHLLFRALFEVHIWSREPSVCPPNQMKGKLPTPLAIFPPQYVSPR